MARPIRDEPTRTAGVGDPVRARTRFTDGYDWIEAGSNALARAGADIATVLSERAKRQDDLADAVAMIRAKGAVAEAIDARLRELDPRSPEYRSQVETIAAEETQRVLASAGLVRQSSRDKLDAEFAVLRGRVLMGAMDRREKALIDDARHQAQLAINAAAAAASMGMSPGQVMLEAEAELAPILAVVDPQIRDQILHAAKATIAAEAIKSLVDRREFAAAEAMFRSYGEQKLLSPTDIRAIKAGIEREKRQALAEARMAQRMAEADLREEVAMAASVEDAQRIIDAAVRDGRLRRGSPLYNYLNRQVAIARRDQEDRSFSVFRDGAAAVDAGLDLSPQREAEFLAAAERIAADSAARELGRSDPNASVETLTEVRRQAAASAREFWLRRMAERRPHDLPATIETDLYRRLSAPDFETRARAAAWIAQNLKLGAEGVLNPRAQKILHETDPHTAAIVHDLITERQPVTAEAIIARRPHAAPPEERTERERVWDRQTRGDKPKVNPTTLLTEAFRKLPAGMGENIPPIAMDRALQLMRASFISGAGLTMEQAAARAAELVAHEFPPNMLAPSARVPAPFNPVVAVPPAIFEQFGERVTARAINDAIEARVMEAVNAYNARRPEGTTELQRGDIEAVPVAVYRGGRPVGITLHLVNTRSPSRALLPALDAAGNPWVLEFPSDPAEFEARFNLRGAQQRVLDLEMPQDNVTAAALVQARLSREAILAVLADTGRRLSDRQRAALQQQLQEIEARIEQLQARPALGREPQR